MESFNQSHNSTNYKVKMHQYQQKNGIPKIIFEFSQRFNIRIETKRLIIESIRMKDTQEFYDNLWSKENVRKTIADGKTRSFQQCIDRINGWQKRWNNIDPFSAMTIRLKHNFKFVGYIVMGYGDQPNSSEVAYESAEEEWGKGYGFEAAGVFSFYLAPLLIKLDFKVNKKQEFKRIIATALTINKASQHILMNCGFSKYGEACQKFGAEREHFQLILPPKVCQNQ